MPLCLPQTRNYTTDKQAGRQLARADVPFLFKAFESGQAPPPRPGTKKAEEPRAATIHEYLDWTVTSNDAEQVLPGRHCTLDISDSPHESHSTWA